MSDKNKYASIVNAVDEISLNKIGINEVNKLDWDIINNKIFNKTLTYNVTDSVVRPSVSVDVNRAIKLLKAVLSYDKINHKFYNFWLLMISVNKFKLNPEFIWNIDYSEYGIDFVIPSPKDTINLSGVNQTLIGTYQKYIELFITEDNLDEHYSIVDTINIIKNIINDVDYANIRKYLDFFNDTLIPLDENNNYLNNVINFTDSKDSGSLVVFDGILTEDQDIRLLLLLWIAKLLKTRESRDLSQINRIVVKDILNNRIYTTQLDTILNLDYKLWGMKSLSILMSWYNLISQISTSTLL